MSSAYTPGLLVTPLTIVQKVRELTMPGEAVVKVGDTVSAESVVLTASLPGELAIIRLPERMGLDPLDIPEGLRITVGQAVRQGDLLCRVSSLFGLFTSEYSSPCSGTVEFFTENNGHLGIRHEPVPISVSAYLAGTIVAVEPKKSVTIETAAAMVQGIFGVGGERNGTVLPLEVDPHQKVTAALLSPLGQALNGAILVGGSSFSSDALALAKEAGVAAIVTGSIDSETLTRFVGFEIGVSITGDEAVPCTLIVTEGFGELPLSNRIVELVRPLAGKQASVNGATQVRAGAMRPELIIPTTASQQQEHGIATQGELTLGSRVRIIRLPYFGAFAVVQELPESPERIESGATVRVLRAALENGEVVTVPRANVELA